MVKKKILHECRLPVYNEKPNCGFYSIMSGENVISSRKEQPISLGEIYDRVERIKRALFPDESERERIKL